MAMENGENYKCIVDLTRKYNVLEGEPTISGGTTECRSVSVFWKNTARVGKIYHMCTGCIVGNGKDVRF